MSACLFIYDRGDTRLYTSQKHEIYGYFFYRFWKVLAEKYIKIFYRK